MAISQYPVYLCFVYYLLLTTHINMSIVCTLLLCVIPTYISLLPNTNLI